jgi:hypothetical protein
MTRILAAHSRLGKHGLLEVLQTFLREMPSCMQLPELFMKCEFAVTKNRFVLETGACFAAGTLIHTKEGLKPIERIEVGEWVLSRPENPDHGTQTDYKRVVRTMVHRDKPVIYGSFNYWRCPASC